MKRWQEELGGPPLSKADMMARLRKDRAEAGLVELRLWLTPEQKERMLKYVARFKKGA